MAAPIANNYRYVAVDRLLPAELISSLSASAVILFEKLWNLAAKKGKDETWVSDNAAAQMSCIAIDAIAPARAELVEAELVTIKYGVWPQNDPANCCHRYTFLVQDESTGQTETGKNFRIPTSLVERGYLSSLSDEAIRLYLLICFR